jgi:hypothetical protein
MIAARRRFIRRAFGVREGALTPPPGPRRQTASAAGRAPPAGARRRFPHSLSCALRLIPGTSVTCPSGRPISHSSNRADNCRPPRAPRTVGAGARRPVTCSHRWMAGAYPAQSGRAHPPAPVPRPNPVPPLGPASDASGVGISITALGSIRSPDEPRWFGPPFSPSVRAVSARASPARPATDVRPGPARVTGCSRTWHAVGVGQQRDRCAQIQPPSPCWPAPFVSEVRGVGSSGSGDDEDPRALVGGADVGSSYAPERSHVPECGQVTGSSGKFSSGSDCSRRSPRTRVGVEERERLGRRAARSRAHRRLPYVARPVTTAGTATRR